MSRVTGLSHRWSLAIILLGLRLGGLGAWLLGSQLAGQFADLSNRLPSAWQTLKDSLKSAGWSLGPIVGPIPAAIPAILLGFRRARDREDALPARYPWRPEPVKGLARLVPTAEPRRRLFEGTVHQAIVEGVEIGDLVRATGQFVTIVPTRLMRSR
ncbi:hypothetical protein [Rhodospirillaceae bacterium SYSU D60014]|uniref:hypothetical protein n=1 Tax=Virgifigura deserti TaxID=2268457 RepID=UPI000E66EC9B